MSLSMFAWSVIGGFALSCLLLWALGALVAFATAPDPAPGSTNHWQGEKMRTRTSQVLWGEASGRGGGAS